MNFTAYLRQIGRGKDGARSLDREQAEDPGRVTSHAVFEALGWPVLASGSLATAADARALATAWAGQRPVFAV